MMRFSSSDSIVNSGLGMLAGRRSGRLTQVVDVVNARGVVRLADLVRDLGVSPATVRRDLTDLEDRGLLVRTHGGARALDDTNELPVAIKDIQFQDAKICIAEYAAQLVPQSGVSVAIGGGSTAAAVARILARRPGLAMVTNSLTTAIELVTHGNAQVIMTGGVVRSSSLEAVGAISETTFNALTVSVAFLGTDGIGVCGGVTTFDQTEARTNHAMVATAKVVVVVADGSKIGRTTVAKVADLSEIDILVTDRSADPAQVAALRETGLDVRVVENQLVTERC